LIRDGYGKGRRLSMEICGAHSHGKLVKGYSSLLNKNKGKEERRI